MAIVFLLAIAGCGGGSAATPVSSSPAASPAASTVASGSAAAKPASSAAAAAPASGAASGSAAAKPAASAAGQPVSGGTLSIVEFTGDPPSLDPYLNTSFRTQEFAAVFYSRLLQYDTGPDVKPNSFKIVGDLSDTWDTSKDGLTYTFHIRDNAKWQNLPPLSGRKLTADDVVYSYQRFTKDGVQKGLMANVADVKAADASHVAFTLKAVDATFLNLIASPVFYIIPKEVVDKDGDLTKTIVGSGPFMFDKYNKGVDITAKRNPDYYISGEPYLDGLDMLIIPSADTAVANFRSKQVDVLPAVPQPQRDPLGKSNADATFYDYPANLLSFFYWRVTGKPFDDVRVRQAVSLALDREELINDLFNGKGVYNSALPAGLGAWWLDPKSADFGASSVYFKRDVNKAKSLLAEAGYQNGLTVPMISTLNAYGDVFNQGVELVQKEIKDAGINVTFQAQDYAAYVSSTYLGKFAEGTMVWGLETPVQEPNDYLFSMYDPAGPRDHGGVNDPKLTQMIEQQKIELDSAKRKQEINAIQQYIGEQEYYVQGPDGLATVAAQPWVKNFYWETDYANIPEVFSKVWLQGKPS
ncbi:MAG: ABC transporter substrate-binding protein [Chloroflexi bacterium]|nr:ABC transporter substrate-binding protein [Chloroflexota bacterium]